MSKLAEILNVCFEMHNRGIGKTTAAANHALEIGATLVCVNRQSAKLVEEEYNIKAIGLESFYADKFRGSKKPVVFDPDALFVVMMAADQEINKLERHITELRKAIDKLKGKNES